MVGGPAVGVEDDASTVALGLGTGGAGINAGVCTGTAPETPDTTLAKTRNSHTGSVIHNGKVRFKTDNKKILGKT